MHQSLAFILIFYITGNICVNNLKSVLSTPLGVAVIATCIHNLSILQQNDDANVKVCYAIGFNKLFSLDVLNSLEPQCYD